MREGRQHPLPVTTELLVRGLKKLRKIDAGAAAATQTAVLFRGMKNVRVTDAFEERGGTELAPMSTSSDIGVAAHYARCRGRSLLFRIVTRNKLQRGAELQWLSGFPGEAEVLFAPLTYMQPTGRSQTISVAGCTFAVVEVETTTA
eukprot:2803540-Rhodomonas_salina.1